MIVVTACQDRPTAMGEVGPGGAERFLSATLRPRITVAQGTDVMLASALHHRVPQVCSIARSANFPIHHAPEFIGALIGTCRAPAGRLQGRAH